MAFSQPWHADQSVLGCVTGHSGPHSSRSGRFAGSSRECANQVERNQFAVNAFQSLHQNWNADSGKSWHRPCLQHQQYHMPWQPHRNQIPQPSHWSQACAHPCTSAGLQQLRLGQNDVARLAYDGAGKELMNSLNQDRAEQRFQSNLAVPRQDGNAGYVKQRVSAQPPEEPAASTRGYTSQNSLMTVEVESEPREFYRDGLPKCICGRTCRLLKVKKQGENKGRQFLVCPLPEGTQCRFFQWADEPLRPICPCGQQAASCTQRKDGPNAGRSFYKCSKASGGQCKFFQWADLLPLAPAVAGADYIDPSDCNPEQEKSAKQSRGPKAAKRLGSNLSKQTFTKAHKHQTTRPLWATCLPPHLRRRYYRVMYSVDTLKRRLAFHDGALVIAENGSACVMTCAGQVVKSLKLSQNYFYAIQIGEEIVDIGIFIVVDCGVEERQVVSGEAFVAKSTLLVPDLMKRRQAMPASIEQPDQVDDRASLATYLVSEAASVDRGSTTLPSGSSDGGQSNAACETASTLSPKLKERKQKAAASSDAWRLQVNLSSVPAFVAVRRKRQHLLQVGQKAAGSLDRAHAVATVLCKLANAGVERNVLRNKKLELLEDTSLEVPALGLDEKFRIMQMKRECQDGRHACDGLAIALNEFGIAGAPPRSSVSSPATISSDALQSDFGDPYNVVCSTLSQTERIHHEFAQTASMGTDASEHPAPRDVGTFSHRTDSMPGSALLPSCSDWTPSTTQCEHEGGSGEYRPYSSSQDKQVALNKDGEHCESAYVIQDGFVTVASQSTTTVNAPMTSNAEKADDPSLQLHGMSSQVKVGESNLESPPKPPPKKRCRSHISNALLGGKRSAEMARDTRDCKFSEPFLWLRYAS